MIIFTRPEYLVLLFAIPIMIIVHFFSLRSIKKRSLKFANFEAIARVKGADIFSKNLTILYINILIIILVVFAISGASMTRQVSASDVSFILALDASTSMDSSDIFPTRLDVAKKAAVDFLDRVPEKTRLGVVSFSGTAFVEQELTENKQEVKMALENLGIKQVGGTDILGAITLSANLLREEDARTIILISDGQANVNTLQDIIDYANKNQIMIHSLGIGTGAGVEGESGAVFKISEDTLKTISQNTEGKYYNIEEIDDFYYSLNDIIEITKKRDVNDLSLYLMIAALALFILNFVLVNTRYRSLP